MIGRVKLNSVEIRNYLGAGDQALQLQLDGHNAVLCGPNGSGKTTVLSVLELLGRVKWATVLQSFSHGQGPNTATLWEWFDSRPDLTANLFHATSETFQVRAGFLLPEGIEEYRRLRPLLPAHQRAVGEPSLPNSEKTTSPSSAVRVTYSIVARRDQKVQLESISLNEHEVFRMGRSTPSAPVVQGDRSQVEGTFRHEVRTADPRDPFEPLNTLLRRVVYFPSYRQPRIGPHGQVGGMAGGEGLISWMEAATNPNPKDAESSRRHNLLKEFETEFADFVGRRSVALSIPKLDTPRQNNEQPEINVTIDGNLRSLPQLGAGIGESLILLLVAKLSQEWQEPAVDIVLVEEPELHIHPALQRKLLDRLSEYGVQLIAATHSATVLNWFTRSRGLVFRTEFDEQNKCSVLKQAKLLAEMRDVLSSIGVSPADILLADKVLLVEGPDDIPVFEAFLGKAPSLRGQNVAVLPLGGATAAASNFDVSHLTNLHPRIWAIIDSERRRPDEDLSEARLTIKSKLESSEIPCYMTDRRATESYFSGRALKAVYGHAPGDLDPFGDPNLAKQGVPQFEKRRNGEVARTMEWTEIAGSDVGKFLERFLTA